jgi:hypothetical protein
MTDDNADTLRRSLDSVDAHRKRLMIALVALGVVLLVMVFYGMHVSGMSGTQALLAHFFMLMIWVTALAVVIVIQIAVATKRILRAIELATRK